MVCYISACDKCVQLDMLRGVAFVHRKLGLPDRLMDPFGKLVRRQSLKAVPFPSSVCLYDQRGERPLAVADQGQAEEQCVRRRHESQFCYITPNQSPCPPLRYEARKQSRNIRQVMN